MAHAFGRVGCKGFVCCNLRRSQGPNALPAVRRVYRGGAGCVPGLNRQQRGSVVAASGRQAVTVALSSITAVGASLATVAFLGLSTATLQHLLHRFGYFIVALFVAIESSGIPFPGETTLILAAVYAGTGKQLTIYGVIIAGALGAIIGDNTGYLVGRYGGRPLVLKYGKYVRIKPEHLDHAERFFDKHGDATVFFGRFVAVLRAWAAFLAGTNRMPWPKFLVFNAAGGIVWACAYGLLGYFLGHNLRALHRVVQLMGIGGVAIAAVVVIAAFVTWRWRRSKQAKAKTD